MTGDVNLHNRGFTAALLAYQDCGSISWRVETVLKAYVAVADNENKLLREALLKIASCPPYPMIVHEQNAWREQTARDALTSVGAL